jgi:hypothetical protein
MSIARWLSSDVGVLRMVLTPSSSDASTGSIVACSQMAMKSLMCILFDYCVVENETFEFIGKVLHIGRE